MSVEPPARLDLPMFATKAELEAATKRVRGFGLAYEPTDILEIVDDQPSIYRF
jgi:hypothetical protein